jgi:hypothetical protein
MKSDKSRTGRRILIVLLAMFVGTTIISGIAAFVAGRQAKRNSEENAALRAEAQQLQSRVQQFQAETRQLRELKDRQDPELKLLRHVLGYGRQSPAELALLRQGLEKSPQARVLEDFDQAVELFGAGLPREEVNYRVLLLHMAAVLQGRDKQLADANEQHKLSCARVAGAEQVLLDLATVAAESPAPESRKKFAYVLGNHAMNPGSVLSSAQRLTPVLEKLTKDPDEPVRITAEAALKEFKSRERPTTPAGAAAKPQADE